VVNCWDNFVFNTTTCAWDNTGVQPEQPAVVNCWDNFVFNTTTCAWDNTGVQPEQPAVVNCWDNFVFNTTTCAWDNTGVQLEQPILECYQTAVFNTLTCQWDVTGEPVTVPVLGQVVNPTCSGTIGSFTIVNFDPNAIYTVTPSTGVSISGAVVTAPVGTYTVVSTVNGCNSGSSLEITIATTPDTVPPVFDQSAPANMEVSCENVPPMDVLTATDNCGPVTVIPNEVIMNGDCPGRYTIIRTWTVTDNVNPAVVLTQTITVVDNQGPVLTSQIDPKASVTCSEIPAAPQPEFQDNCSGVVNVQFTETESAVVDNTYTITRTWVASDACGNNSEVYTQIIYVTLEAELVTEVLKGACNQAEFDVIDLTTLLPTGTPANGTWANVDNIGGLNGTGFNAYQIPVGVYTFAYTYRDESPCPKTVNVKVDVKTDCGVLPCNLVIVHNAFTPNGDTFNEFFNIENIEDFGCYPTNKVEIYNRWGVLVYETNNYDNNTRKFVGISEGRVTVDKSAELPTGTYFYIIQYTTTDGATVTKDGYLYLTR
uniref:gliding motility-associated C-terminal domain-containing protein n=1 Tax=Flavobacterium sp. TaxID=239 RepID=UPI0035B13443